MLLLVVAMLLLVVLLAVLVVVAAPDPAVCAVEAPPAPLVEPVVFAEWLPPPQ
jgi:hypothetical protein